MREDIKEAYDILCKVGLHPEYHKDIVSAAKGVATIVAHLRNELADPPPDVQEQVLHKLGLWDVLRQLESAYTEKKQLEEEIADLNQQLEKLVRCGCESLRCKTCTPMKWMHQQDDQIVTDTDLYIYG